MDEAFHLIKVTNIYQLFCQNPPLSRSVRPQNQKKIRNRPAAEELWPLRQRINEIFFLTVSQTFITDPAFIAMETTRRHWPGRKIRKKITHLSDIKFSDLGVHRIGVLKKKK